ncbi:MAG: sigma-70 family polymerase sigma factor [Ilumatobacteraceae bacterium]|nr:sigma-70 family polymerase sigma factor [Ilumatobacteraceae bacterium]MCU1387117.1 sigma-70 family polymerase sigma factor [Ilumatobacteraceae bacterium]
MNVTPTTTAAVPVVTISDWDMTVTRTYEASRHGLIAAASRIVGCDHAADVVQEVFIRVWSHPDSFDPTRGTLTGYLYLVTRGMSIDRLRSIASQADRDSQDTFRTVVPDDEPVSAMIAHQQLERVRQALAVLCEGQRDVILAAYFGHLTYRQVAVRLGIPEGTVKSRIRLGLLRMRAELARAEAIAP